MVILALVHCAIHHSWVTAQSHGGSGAPFYLCLFMMNPSENYFIIAISASRTIFLLRWSNPRGMLGPL